MIKKASNIAAHSEREGAAPNRARNFVGRRKALGRVLLALLGLVLTGVVVAYRLASHPPEQTRISSQPLLPNTQQQLAGYSFTRSEGGREIFTVHARRTLTMKGAEASTLEGVEIEIFGKTGRQHDLLRTDRCEYEPTQGNFSCAGAVDIELNAAASDPASATGSGESSGRGGQQTVFLETSGLSYDQDSSILTTVAP